jgi:hypothetical protein
MTYSEFVRKLATDDLTTLWLKTGKLYENHALPNCRDCNYLEEHSCFKTGTSQYTCRAFNIMSPDCIGWLEGIEKPGVMCSFVNKMKQVWRIW